MKENLLTLINKTEDIEKLFHKSLSEHRRVSMPIDTICDIQEFHLWLQDVKYELQEIYDRTKDTFIFDALNDLSKTFNGW